MPKRTLWKVKQGTILRHYLADSPRGTVLHLINSYFDREPDLDLLCYLEANELVEGDLVIAERLLRAFTSAFKDEDILHKHDRPNQGVWEMVKHEFHGTAYKLLMEEDVPRLADYLSNALRTSWSYGLGTGPSVYQAFAAGGEDRAANVLLIKDRLVSLAIALGVVPQELSEMGRYGENIHMTLKDLVALIEGAVKVEICRPKVMGMFGLTTGENKVIDPRLPDDVYAADRLRSLSIVGHVAEIGGGFGGAAFQCTRVGLRTSLFDLPVISVLQGYFLIKALGGAQVKLYGEEIDDRLANVLPWWSFYDRSRDFDVVFNRDSMAEFPTQSATSYMSEMKDRGLLYLSINQEVESASGQTGINQVSVSRLASNVGLRRNYRFPYWIRRGFVEELFSSP